MNKQEAEQFREAQRRAAPGFLEEAQRDQPFYGNGTRYQNIWGQPAHWWQISFDTSRASSRAARNVSLLLACFAWMTVLIVLLVSLFHGW
jgi:hypothetical protein